MFRIVGMNVINGVKDIGADGLFAIRENLNRANQFAEQFCVLKPIFWPHQAAIWFGVRRCCLCVVRHGI